MRIFYIIVKFICFPGAFMRGFWEQLTCRVLRLQVEPLGYIRPDEACGHVEHSLSKTQFSAYLISTGPGFMNFNMGMAFFFWGFINLKHMGITPWDNLILFIVYLLSMYIGISLLNCLFPLTEDIINYWSIAYGPLGGNKNAVRSMRDGIGGIIGFPFALITRVGAFLESKGIIFILWVAYLIYRFCFT